jgi:hypothetical protein
VIGPNGIKAPIAGLIDRNNMPSSAFYGVIDAYVVNVSWAALQPTQWGPINGAPIDQAIALVRGANGAGAHLSLKLRIFAAISAPAWAKSIGGAPIAIYDSGFVGTVGRYWLPAFGAAYQDLQNKLAARYDTVPEIREVTISQCTTVYVEPMIRQIPDPTTMANLVAAGYTVAADQACQQQQILAHAVWRHTRSDLALNPYQYIVSATTAGISEPFTEQMMSYCRQVLRNRCMLENNSLRSVSMGPNYAQMYAAIKARGPNIVFQTATLAKVGSLTSTLGIAVSLGAASVELPAGYQALGPAALASVRPQLAANAMM